MKRVALVLVALALLAACTHHKGQASQRASSLATNATVAAEKTQAEAIIQRCQPANEFTLAKKAVRTKMVNCIAPDDPAARQKVETCISTAISKDALTKSGRALLNSDIDACVVMYAGKGK